MEIKDVVIRCVRKCYRLLTSKHFYQPDSIVDRQKANDIIFAHLTGNNPCMISRFGTTEMNCLVNYITVHSNKPYIKKLIDFVTDWTATPWWNKDHFEVMSLWSGIFPPCLDTAERFAEKYFEDIPLIDILGSFQYQEKFMPLKSNIIKVHLETLYPFYVERPWTRCLKGKKVLVVHPFENTIRFQYNKRSLLFKNDDVLPEFTLITLKAVQSVANTKVPFKDWFEALDYMKNQINNIDFDYCLLGCGAYGLPLAAHVKRMGKKAIHLGGGLQLLFGIKGKRWVDQYEEYWNIRPGVKIYTNYKPLFNDSWIYPLDSEKPKNAKVVENACYWK